MEERFYREQEIARLPAFLPAATYNLAHTLLARAGKCLFVPIRSLQYLAVLDAEEFFFVDGQNKAWVELAWQHFHPQARASLDERVPFEVVHSQRAQREIIVEGPDKSLLDLAQEIFLERDFGQMHPLAF